MGGQKVVSSGNVPETTICVVDDDPSVRKGLSRLLRSEGFGVVTFSNGEEFLENSGLSRIGCFVIDIQLGGMNGLEVARILKEREVCTPCIFITAHDEAMTRDALQAAGSPTCLRKPFDADEFLSSLRLALASSG